MTDASKVLVKSDQLVIDCPRAEHCHATLECEPFYDYRAPGTVVGQKIKGIFCNCEWARALAEVEG